MIKTIEKNMQKQIEAILREPILRGNTIISSSEGIEKVHILTCFKNHSYFLNLYTKYCSSTEGEGVSVKLSDCSQRLEGNVMSVYSELVKTGPVEAAGDVIKVQLTIPGDSYLVRNMICIPELLKMLFSYPHDKVLNSTVFHDILKINP